MNWKRTCAAGLLLGSVALILATLVGCAPYGSVSTQRDLPAPPVFAKPISVLDPQPGDSAIAVAARERAGRVQANSTIIGFRNWYAGVRRSYASKD